MRIAVDFRRPNRGRTASPLPLQWRQVTQYAFLLALTLFVSRLFGVESNVPSGDERIVVGKIVADRHALDSVLDVLRKADKLPADRRYAFLADWVLPSATHQDFRLAIDFTPTQAAPRPIFSHRRPPSAAPLSNAKILPVNRAGAELISPALELVDTAAQLRCLPELRARIHGSNPREELQQRNRLALLGIVDLAAGDTAQAVESLDELFRRVARRRLPGLGGSWPETLAVEAGLRHPITRDAATEAVFRMLEGVRFSAEPGLEPWNHWVRATAGAIALSRGRDSSVGGDSDTASNHDSRQAVLWSAASRATAWSRGRGISNAAWAVGRDELTNFVSHTEDYLYFNVPLRGDFDIECDVTSFEWRESHLMIAGMYVAPIFDHVSFGLGTFRNSLPMGRIEPRLSPCTEWIRYRTTIRNGICTTHFNGRPIHSHRLQNESDPWVAIRSAWDADGAVRSFRISGNPVIPEEIVLTAHAQLDGWFDYFDSSVGGEDASWQQSEQIAKTGGTFGKKEPNYSGQAHERLLQYHRPMFEDGVIEYSFFYRPGVCEVHPAIDRQAWVVHPDSVRVHWVTDGRAERTGMEPLNLEARRADSSAAILPLKADSWNAMRIELTGNQVALFLNDQLIHRDDLSPTSSRRFGLFYWCDQTEALIRNVRWRGNWPRRLPSHGEALKGTPEWLDAGVAALQSSIEYDFARPFPVERFVINADPRHSVGVAPNGIRMTTNGDKDYFVAWLGAKLRVHGDFDITAEYDGLDFSGTVHSTQHALLMTVIDDPELTHMSVFRGLVREPKVVDRHCVQTEIERRKPSGVVKHWPGPTVEECTSGSLRLARRDSTMYFLAAEGDSRHYRLIHTEPVPKNETIRDGIRLLTASNSQIDGSCRAAVTWKRLTIRADKITDLPSMPTLTDRGLTVSDDE